ncbi:MAG: hypothetical protein ACLU5C_06725 [Acutalibacter sp.]
MTKKEWQRRMAYEALVILGMLALLLFVCRLWPILLLVILGIFAAALRLVFLSSPKVQPIHPEQQTSVSSVPQHAVKSQRTAQNVEDTLSFGELQTQVTRWVRQEYPEARWVWKYPDAKARFQRGEELAILLNRAGGYREASILLRGQRLFEIRYLCAPAEKPQLGQPEEPASPQEEQPTLEEAASQPEPSQPEDYSLAAFEWVEAHLEELNTLCNECIAQKQDFLLLTGGDLPEPAAWPALCQELARNGLSCRVQEEGVQIEITREDRRKE